MFKTLKRLAARLMFPDRSANQKENRKEHIRGRIGSVSSRNICKRWVVWATDVLSLMYIYIRRHHRQGGLTCGSHHGDSEEIASYTFFPLPWCLLQEDQSSTVVNNEFHICLAAPTAPLSDHNNKNGAPWSFKPIHSSCGVSFTPPPSPAPPPPPPVPPGD